MTVSHLAAVSADNRVWLQWMLWGLLMSLIMGWVARSRSRPGHVGSHPRLQHPTSTLVIGLAGFLLFTAIAVISNVFANATTSWKTTTVFVGFALLALPILGDYFAARHEISEEGLRYGRLIGSGGYMPWTELKSVRFSEAMKWFRLAADQSDHDAQLYLAYMYERGQGVSQDKVRAYMWFNLCAAQDDQYRFCTLSVPGGLRSGMEA